MRVQDGRLFVRVADDGRGCDPAAPREARSFGILGIRERALSLGGTVRFESEPGHGMTVVIDLPLEPFGTEGAGA